MFTLFIFIYAIGAMISGHIHRYLGYFELSEKDKYIQELRHPMFHSSGYISRKMSQSEINATIFHRIVWVTLFWPLPITGRIIYHFLTFVSSWTLYIFTGLK